MGIKEIEMRNVKGQTARQELTGKDIIIGRNGAGKTTRLQSIGLAMLGYVPGKGKTTADTFQLASDDEMSVRMETDAFGFERSFVKTRKMNKDGDTEVKISQKLSVSPSKGETTNTQKEQRIRMELGDFPVMLDFGAFIGMTDNQQRDFIYNLSGAGFTWDRQRVETELRTSLLNPDMEEKNKELYDCMVAAIEDTIKQYRDGMDIQAGILAMSEHAKDQLKYWKKERANAEGAAKKLTELKNRCDNTDRDLTINQEKLKELQEKKEQLIKTLAELASKNKALEEKKAELLKLQEEIEQLEVTPDSNRMTELESTIGTLGVEVADAEATLPEYENKETAIQNELASLQEALKVENEKMAGLKEELANINAGIKANSDLLQRIADSHGCCAFSPNIPCNQNFSEFIEETNHTMDEAYEKKDEVEHRIHEANTAIGDLQEKIKSAQEEQKKLGTAKKDAVKSIEEKKKQIEQNHTELVSLQGREPVLAAKKQQEAILTEYLADNQPVDLTAMEDEKAILTGQIESLTATIDEQKKVRNDLANIKANIIDSQTATFNEHCWDKVNTALGQKGIKGAMTKETLAPLREDINDKLHGIGIHEEFFFETNSDTGKEIFEFGWANKPFAALSTGEQLLLMTALMTTMIERANPPIKVLAIDDINNLDSENQKKILAGINTIATNMDNVIIAGVSEITEDDAPGWKIWRV